MLLEVRIVRRQIKHQDPCQQRSAVQVSATGGKYRGVTVSRMKKSQNTKSFRLVMLLPSRLVQLPCGARLDFGADRFVEFQIRGRITTT